MGRLLGEKKRFWIKRFKTLCCKRRLFLYIVLIYLSYQAFSWSSRNQVQSLILDVPYHDQQTSYFCGPASVKMVLDYTQNLEISQDTLSYELLTDENEGVTYTELMDEPFIHRDLTQIKNGRLSLNQLKKQMTFGYAPILLIWFDDNQEKGHYIVAVGYNETGVFVNDPWPSYWGEPDGRETGPFVYLSNEKLLDLWSIRRNWAMTVAFTPSENELLKVDVSISGLPEDLKTRLTLNGETVDSLNVNDKASLIMFDNENFLSVETIVHDGDAVYYCTNNLQRTSGTKKIQFVYNLLYK